MRTCLDTASAAACCSSSSEEFSPCSIMLATIFRRSCCSVVRELKMWLAQILARCPALLQFLHSTSGETLQSFRVCTVLPHRLHFPSRVWGHLCLVVPGGLRRFVLSFLALALCPPKPASGQPCARSRTAPGTCCMIRSAASRIPGT